MQTLKEALADDANPFAPGTDLVLALVALLLVMVAMAEGSHRKAMEAGGAFKLASHTFAAGEFSNFPVDSLTDPEGARLAVRRIVDEYRSGRDHYPYVFVIGHANVIDARDATDRSEGTRRGRNWNYSGRRAALIARLLQERLTSGELDQMVVVSTGEFDLRDPAHPAAPENACVEVVFGKEWKLPSRKEAVPMNLRAQGSISRQGVMR